MHLVSCRVCGEALARQGTPPVTCLACETSYHVDCWAYTGGTCGVYGCGGRRAVAGLAGQGPAPELRIADGPRLWQRGLASLTLTGVNLAALVTAVVLAFRVPWAGVAMAMVAAHLARLLTCSLEWLRAVSVDEDGIDFAYLCGRKRRIEWGQVLRGPGRGDWTGALLLQDGEVMLLPAGEPGFDEVQGRIAVALARRDLEKEPVIIRET